jgi:3-hydroxyisobutyrate dehydrogenase-like beta-hydroxyacid dehydrogenase
VVLIVVVVDAAQAREVLFGPSGAAPHLPPGSVLLLCPTLGPDDVVEIAHRLAQHGVHTLDAPMSGGPARATDGSMSLMLAGPRFARHQLAPLLDAVSNQQFHLGEQVGDAARTKLVNNLLAAINLAGAAEALALAQRLGLDGRQTLAVIEQSSGHSWIAQDRMRRALDGDLAPRAHTTLLAKDSALALAAAHSVGVRPALGQLAAQRFAEVCAQGGAQWDDACLFQFAGGQKETGAA